MGQRAPTLGRVTHSPYASFLIKTMCQVTFIVPNALFSYFNGLCCPMKIHKTDSTYIWMQYEIRRITSQSTQGYAFLHEVSRIIEDKEQAGFGAVSLPNM